MGGSWVPFLMLSPLSVKGSTWEGAAKHPALCSSLSLDVNSLHSANKLKGRASSALARIARNAKGSCAALEDECPLLVRREGGARGDYSPDGLCGCRLNALWRASMCENDQGSVAPPLGALSVNPCKRRLRHSGFRCLRYGWPQWCFQISKGVFRRVLRRSTSRCSRGTVAPRPMLWWRRGVPHVSLWLRRRRGQGWRNLCWKQWICTVCDGTRAEAA